MSRSARPVLMVLVAAALSAAAARPCPARGTGGFLRDWTVCGPLKGTRLDEPKLPADFAGYPGLFAADRVWLALEAEPQGRVNLRGLYPESGPGTAMLHTFFELDADGTYRLRIGSDDAVQVEIDGRTVHRNDVHRAWGADQDRVEVKLARGWHRMLVRVVDYGGDWAASVRLADARDQPIDVRHQSSCPAALARECGLDRPATVGERAAAATFLAEEAAQLLSDLEAALPRLTEMPEGYVTFADYEGAKHLGQLFFEAMASLWREVLSEVIDDEAVRAAQHTAAESARGFSEVLAQETERIARSLVRQRKLWETLGGEELAQRGLAEATGRIAGLLAATRRLAERVEGERLLAARFENDIRNFRQRDVAIRVVDAEGGPVADAEVEVVQMRHDFLFGCNLFAFRRWDDERKNRAYEQRFRDLFNSAVVPLYWSVVEKRRGRPDFGPTDDAVRWCRENRIEVRGHPLLWQDAVPRWAEELTDQELRRALGAYIRATLGRYRDTVQGWDVVQQPAETMRIGRATIEAAEVLRWAADANPAGRLLVGGGPVKPLAELARGLRGRGVRLDGLAPAAAQHEGVWPLEQLRATLQQAASADLPVHVSEVAILGGPNNEAEQAEAVRHFYTAAFAHPQVASITWWDLSDQYAWRNAPAGLLRADLSPKAAYKVLDRLINHLWRTDAAGRTGADGKVLVRAFFGGYRMTARAQGREATVDAHVGRGGAGEIEIVLPPRR